MTILDTLLNLFEVVSKIYHFEHITETKQDCLLFRIFLKTCFCFCCKTLPTLVIQNFVGPFHSIFSEIAFLVKLAILKFFIKFRIFQNFCYFTLRNLVIPNFGHFRSICYGFRDSIFGSSRPI